MKAITKIKNIKNLTMKNKKMIILFIKSYHTDNKNVYY